MVCPQPTVVTNSSVPASRIRIDDEDIHYSVAAFIVGNLPILPHPVSERIPT